MELTQKAIDYFKLIGVDPGKVSKLLEPENDIDVSKLVTEYKTVAKQTFKSELEPEFQERLNEEFGKSRIKFMRDINKTYELGLTNEQIKDSQYDSFLEESKKIIKGKNKEFSSEEMSTKIKEISENYEKSVNNLKSDYETKIGSAETNLNKYISKSEFLSVWNNKKLGVPDAQKDFYKDAFYNELTEKYKIMEGNKISNQDGTPIMNPEGNGLWSTIDDVLDHKINVLQIGKKSGGTETGNNFTPPINFTNDQKQTQSSAADAIAARARAKGIMVN